LFFFSLFSFGMGRGGEGRGGSIYQRGVDWESNVTDGVVGLRTNNK
jgi:outer membrane receptor for monomeric catechols